MNAQEYNRSLLLEWIYYVSGFLAGWLVFLYFWIWLMWDILPSLRFGVPASLLVYLVLAPSYLKLRRARKPYQTYNEAFARFRWAMITAMVDHDAEKGDTWKTSCSEAYLLDKLAVQFEDMQVDPDREDYLANIANYCAMLWINKADQGRPQP